MSQSAALADQPPADQPPADQPPADQPPADQPPADQPNAAKEPREATPPAQTLVVEGSGEQSVIAQLSIGTESADALRSLEFFQFELSALVNDESSIPDKKILGEYILLSMQMDGRTPFRVIETARLGLACATKNNVVAAEIILREVHFRTSVSSALSEVMRGLFLFISVVFLLSYAAAAVVLIDKSQIVSNFAYDNKNILIAILFGSLGSVVSILLRLAEFEVMRGRSRNYLRYTGASLPIIGGTFAAVVAALLDAGIINMQLGTAAGNGGLNTNLFIIVGFLSGFSERFAKGLLQNVEAKISSQPSMVTTEHTIAK